MASKELFIVGLRLFGVWQLLRVIDYAVMGFDMKVGFYATRNYDIQSYYTHGSVCLVVGLYLLGGAPQVVRFFYPPIPAASKPKPPADPAES